MPKTRFESIIFTMLMVFCMVYCMTCYTIALGMGGLTLPVFGMALREMWVEYILVFCLIFFCVTNMAKKMALRIINPQKDSPIFLVVAIQSFTVCLIVPMITLFATFFHGGVADWFTRWLQTAFLCFPVALCLQVFFVGPFVRWVFRCIFLRGE